MNYLRDKQSLPWRRKRKIGFFLVSTLIIIFLLIFRKSILNSLVNSFQNLGSFIWPNSNKVKESLSDYNYIFKTKQALYEENENLKEKLAELTVRQIDHVLSVEENIKLKEIFNRKEDRNLILAAILAKPSQSPYDTLIVDVGFEQGIEARHKVFALGNILIGQVSEVYAKTSLVKLYSSPGEKVDALLSGKDIYVQAIGRGNQNFEIILPQDLAISRGDEILVPSLSSQILGIVLEVIADPRDPLQKVILRSPVNIQELKFVQVETSAK